MISYEEFVDDIRRGLKIRERHQYRRVKRAGILLPFIFDEGDPRLLLTRRTEKLSSHRGEVAFPGGMKDDIDLSIEETALREAYEEVGLEPERVEVIGQLDDLISKNEEVMVTPHIGVIREPPPLWSPNKGEVARVFEVPLVTLYDTSRWRTEHREWRGHIINIYYFDYDGEVLWGLSAYATLLALDLTAAGSPVDLSEYYRQTTKVKSILRAKD